MEATKRLYVHFVLAKQLSDYDKELKQNLKQLIKKNCIQSPFTKIEKVVCDYFGISPETIHQKTRVSEVVKYRQISMYFILKTAKNATLTKVGNFYNKNHTTVYWAKKKVEELMSVYSDYRNDIENIKIKL